MNKSVFLSAIAVLATSFCIIGCNKKPELKNMRALVKSVYIDGNDTVRSMVVSSGEDSLVFSLMEAKLNNGMVLPKDSVIVDYIDGKNDTARALVVTVLPGAKKQVKLEDNANNKLITAPADKVNK